MSSRLSRYVPSAAAARVRHRGLLATTRQLGHSKSPRITSASVAQEKVHSKRTPAEASTALFTFTDSYLWMFIVWMVGGFTALEEKHAENKEWLEQNKKRPRVVETESGLQYKILRRGEGQKHPLPWTECEILYEARTQDGEIFDSCDLNGLKSVKMKPNDALKGMKEALEMMVEGDVWELYLNSELGWGDSKKFGTTVLGFQLEPGALVVYRVELLVLRGSGGRWANNTDESGKPFHLLKPAAEEPDDGFGATWRKLRGVPVTENTAGGPVGEVVGMGVG